MKLSICIATFNRGSLIGQTLDTIGPQLGPETELVIVDGGSTDGTRAVVEQARHRWPNVRYHPQSTNSGVDADFDKAVGLATGEFCWLMSDDDFIKPGAIATVLSLLTPGRDLLVVNAEARTADMTAVLAPRLMPIEGVREYHPADWDQFFVASCQYLSFIGGVVIRRAVWQERDRQSYIGTAFIHVGVIFQRPLQGVAVIVGDPLVELRYANAMWTARGFEIWMFKWPRLVWSFAFSDASKARVYPAEPWRRLTTLALYRAVGAFSGQQCRTLLAPRTPGRVRRAVHWAIAHIPRWPLGIAISGYLHVLRPGSALPLADLQRSRRRT